MSSGEQCAFTQINNLSSNCIQRNKTKFYQHKCLRYQKLINYISKLEMQNISINTDKSDK